MDLVLICMHLKKHIKYSYLENVKYFYGEKDRRKK